MAVLHDFLCETCDRTFESVVNVDQLPAGPPCPTCASPTIRVFLPPAVSWSPDAVVVYRAPDGSFRFPGENAGTSTAKYDKMGYERIEARGFAEVRSLERRMNQHELSQMRRRHERVQQFSEQGESLRRSELRSRMSSMSRLGRDMARAAMTRNDRKGRQGPQESGLRVDAYSTDRSNREESRRVDGTRHRD